MICNATIVHVCSACHREVSEPAPPGLVLEVPGPPWYCDRRACQDAKAKGLVFGWAIQPAGEAAWLFLERIADVPEHILEGDDDEEWLIKRVGKTKAEWDALPEFDGW